jgi:hypothetical protein
MASHYIHIFAPKKGPIWQTNLAEVMATQVELQIKMICRLWQTGITLDQPRENNGEASEE